MGKVRLRLLFHKLTVKGFHIKRAMHHSVAADSSSSSSSKRNPKFSGSDSAMFLSDQSSARRSSTARHRRNESSSVLAIDCGCRPYKPRQYDMEQRHPWPHISDPSQSRNGYERLGSCMADGSLSKSHILPKKQQRRRKRPDSSKVSTNTDLITPQGEVMGIKNPLFVGNDVDNFPKMQTKQSPCHVSAAESKYYNYSNSATTDISNSLFLDSSFTSVDTFFSSSVDKNRRSFSSDTSSSSDFLENYINARNINSSNCAQHVLLPSNHVNSNLAPKQQQFHNLDAVKSSPLNPSYQNGNANKRSASRRSQKENASLEQVLHKKNFTRSVSSGGFLSIKQKSSSISNADFDYYRVPRTDSRGNLSSKTKKSARTGGGVGTKSLNAFLKEKFNGVPERWTPNSDVMSSSSSDESLLSPSYSPLVKSSTNPEIENLKQSIIAAATKRRLSRSTSVSVSGSIKHNGFTSRSEMDHTKSHHMGDNLPNRYNTQQFTCHDSLKRSANCSNDSCVIVRANDANNCNVSNVAASQRSLTESVAAVVTSSSDPLVDFRNSMVDMILEKQIYTPEDLEELLKCFLLLNSQEHHDTIVQAFTQVWESLNGCKPA